MSTTVYTNPIAIADLVELSVATAPMPLMFEDSPQAVWMIPMAVSLGWGIVFATSITLLLVPVLILIFNDFNQFLIKLYGIDLRDHDDENTRIPAGI